MNWMKAQKMDREQVTGRPAAPARAVAQAAERLGGLCVPRCTRAR
jgi:hypothetical protein